MGGRAFSADIYRLIVDFSIFWTDFSSFCCCNSVSISDLSSAMQPVLGTDLEIDSAMTLNQVGVGCDVRIRVLNGPACDRLRDLGFCEQLQVRKLAGGRNLICSVCGTKLAISKDLAEQVVVAPLA